MTPEEYFNMLNGGGAPMQDDFSKPFIGTIPAGGMFPGHTDPNLQTNPVFNVDPGMSTNRDFYTPPSGGGQNVYDPGELQNAINGINQVSGPMPGSTGGTGGGWGSDVFGPGGVAGDPFSDLLQQYLNDPSGYLASNEGGGGVPPPGSGGIWGSDVYSNLDQGPLPSSADQPFAEPDIPPPPEPPTGIPVATPAGGPSQEQPQTFQNPNQIYRPPQQGYNPPGMIRRAAGAPMAGVRTAGRVAGTVANKMGNFFNFLGTQDFHDPAYLASIGYRTDSSGGMFPGGTSTLGPRDIGGYGVPEGQFYGTQPGDPGAVPTAYGHVYHGPLPGDYSQLGAGSGGRIYASMLNDYWQRHMMPQDLWAATQSWMQPYGGSWSDLLNRPVSNPTYADYSRDFSASQDLMQRVAAERAANPPKDFNARAQGIEGAPQQFAGRAGGGTRPA